MATRDYISTYGDYTTLLVDYTWVVASGNSLLSRDSETMFIALDNLYKYFVVYSNNLSSKLASSELSYWC
jgi:hypothetical protein